MIDRSERRRWRKVFVRAPNWLGDVIMATPALARIRSWAIEAELVLGGRPGHAAVLSGCRSFDRYLPLPKRRGLGDFLREVARLRAERFDAAVILPNSFSSALSAACARIPVRIGYLQGRGPLLTHGVRARAARRRGPGPRREPMPMVDYWFALLDAFEMPRVGPKPILRVPAGDERAAAELLTGFGLAPSGRLVLLNPGAAFGPSKLWPEESWGALARGLAADLGPGDLVLILAGPGEEALARRILERAAGAARVRAAVDPLVPLGPLKAVVRRAALMVTTDSGPRHVAVAFDVPHIVLMGPTHPGYTARNLEHALVLRREVDCGPCHLPHCPTDHRCLRGIGPDEVLAAARRLLIEADSRSGA